MENVRKPRIAVIGGINTDICGKPFTKPVRGDSIPGAVSVKPGGVGRNIAHNLKLLGAEVEMVSAVGADIFGRNALGQLKALGIGTEMVRVMEDRGSSVYLYTTDETGDMVSAVNDMGITECITPEYVASLTDRLNGFDALVIDANIPEETIKFICTRCTAPVYADAVSAAKAERLLPVLGKLAALKPNRLEAEKLSGESDPARAAEALQRAGVGKVFVSLGAGGLIACVEGRLYRQPCIPVKVKNTTGAGDAATAAIVMADLAGFSPERCLLAAARAGAVTVGCDETNNPDLTAEALYK